MKICKKCGREFPKSMTVNGKRIILNSRKFCLECSPYGQHNTRNLNKKNKSNVHTRICTSCGKEYNAQNRKGAQCYSCYFNRKRDIKIAKVQTIVGDSCWLCGYDRYWGNLHFHHIDPKTKCFSLTTRELVGHKWGDVLSEIKKCVLICNRCHGEVHGGITPAEEVKKIYEERWS